VTSLQDYFLKAKQEKWAIGHFNFSTADQLKAIIEAAAEVKSPVMVATSEGEAKFFGRDQAVALVKSYQAEGYAVYLNADHHKSFTTTKSAIDAGYDTVLIDASKLNFQENVEETKKVVDYAHSIKPGMMVEGEIGYLRGESQVQETVEISSADYTKPEEAADFLAKTGVDRLAVVFGNIHGIVKEVIVSAPTPEGVGAPTITSGEENLDVEHFKKIVFALPSVYFVLHGASGLKANQVQAAIAAGITNVHINTEIRVAYHDALRAKLEADPTQTTPYKYLDDPMEAIKKLVKEKLELFGSVGKA